MQGFGNFKDIDKLKSFTEAIQKEDVIETKLTSDEEAKLENVTVVRLENDEYSPEEAQTEGIVKTAAKIAATAAAKKVGEVVVDKLNNKDEEPKAQTEAVKSVKNEPEEGAAGNKEDDEKGKEPLMGGMSMDMGMGKEKLSVSPEIGSEMSKKGLEEGFDKDVTVDEDPTKEATKRTENTMSSNDLKDVSIKKASDMMNALDEIRGKEYDFDTEKDCGTTISNDPINAKDPAKKVPKGW